MKIKNVKIQAFKSYLNEKDSTFDFSWKKDPSQVANLISIYAPNGFGKTSFYDAVDFCYTNNITRYIRDDNVRIQNKKNANQQIFILRNRNAENRELKLDTKVSIETDDNTQLTSPIIEHALKGSDYKFDDSKTPLERKYFRDLMLSQEAIDAFLKETNPVERFKKFATKQVNDLSQLNERRIIISQLLSDIESEIREKVTREKVKKNELSHKSLDEGIIQKLNSEITKCNDLGLRLQKISEGYDLNSHNELKMNITEAILEVNTESVTLDEKLKLKHSFIESFERLEKNVNELKQSLDDIAELRNLLDARKNIFEINTLVKQLNVEKNLVDSKINRLTKFKNESNRLSDLIQKKNSLSKENLSEEKLENESNIKLNQANGRVEELRVEISSISLQLESHQDQKKNLNDLFENVENIAKDKTTTTRKLEEINNRLASAKREASTNDSALKVLSGVDIKNYVEPTDFIINYSTLNELYSKYKNNSEIIEKVDIQIEEIKSELARLKDQRNSVSELVKLGYQLVNSSKTPNCPLCKYDYDTFENLRTAIERNDIFASISDKRIKDLATLENKKFEIIKKNKISEREYQQLIVDQKSKVLSARQSLETQAHNLGKDKIELDTKLSSLINEEAEIKKQTLSMSPNQLLDHLTQKIKQLKNNLTQTQNKLVNTQREISDFHKQINSRNKNSLEVENGLKRLYQDVVFKDFEEFQKDQSIHLEQRGENLKSELTRLENNFTTFKLELSNRIESLHADIDALTNASDEKYLSFSEEQIKRKIQDKENEKKETENVINSYNSLFIEPFNYLENFSDSKDIVKEALRNSKMESKVIQEKHSSLSLLTSLANEALSLSEGVKLRRELSEITKQRAGLQKLKQEMDSDITLIDEEIKNYIEGYFYVDLINNIYNAIDPHPEFNSVSFKYIANKNPELHIKVKGNSGDEKVAPALHFSSAQINVLSLSIFLAKALNTKTHDGQYANCIFIDDPVQSMDAINVLSVIDLFRNIVDRFNKQLIISTHDENFHELLKKKVPSNIFKSKFLKLESFGKVAVDE